MGLGKLWREIKARSLVLTPIGEPVIPRVTVLGRRVEAEAVRILPAQDGAALAREARWRRGNVVELASELAVLRRAQVGQDIIGHAERVLVEMQAEVEAKYRASAGVVDQSR